MIKGLDPIKIRDLEKPPNQKLMIFEIYLEGIDSSESIQGKVDIKYEDNQLKIKAIIQTSINLICDNYLATFQHEINHECIDLICIGKEDFADKFTIESLNQCSEWINPNDSFHPEKWIFEQISLQTPVFKLCGNSCPGPYKFKDKFESKNALDPRWSELEKFIKS